MFEPDSASPSYPQWFKQQCHYQNMFFSRPCSFALWWTKTHQPRKQKRWKWYEPIWPFEKFWKWYSKWFNPVSRFVYLMLRNASDWAWPGRSCCTSSHSTSTNDSNSTGICACRHRQSVLGKKSWSRCFYSNYQRSVIVKYVDQTFNFIASENQKFWNKDPMTMWPIPFPSATRCILLWLTGVSGAWNTLNLQDWLSQYWQWMNLN